MTEELQMIFDEATEKMENALTRLSSELAKIRAGKASPAMLSGVMVEYYGSVTPLSQVANVNTPDAKTITIQPWEKSLLQDIEKAIFDANLGLTPQNNGESIIINVPPVTEERRLELVKRAKAEGEYAKVSIRNARREANDNIKAEQKEGLAEDMAKDAEAKTQDLTNSYSTKVDDLLSEKEKTIMAI
jgi:ribosome recycling factor